MQRRKRFAVGLAALFAGATVVAAVSVAPVDAGGKGPPAEARFATFNASLNRFNQGDLAAELAVPGSDQPDAVAEIIQRTRPDVLLINEFDYDPGGVAAAEFQQNYLSVAHGTADPIDYPHVYVAPSNTGVPSGRDLDKNGFIGGPGDAFGFGFFEGQFAFVVYSMYPIDDEGVRTFQNFLWKDMPGALLPVDPVTGESFYDEGDLEIFRLSSKNHTDVPIEIGDRTVHFLVNHPTPPVFDGPEDRNGTRNHDEIRLWADYVQPARSGYIVDDDGNAGGLHGSDRFVIAGDQNADPLDGDSVPGAAQQLLDNPKVNSKGMPDSLGAVEQADLQGGANDSHLGDPAFDTADFNDLAPFGPGNLRVDYVLPRNNMNIDDAGVFWPLSDDPLFPPVGTFQFPSSDHRLVWVDVDVN
jgi:3-phytase/alkaline phosphatase D